MKVCPCGKKVVKGNWPKCRTPRTPLTALPRIEPVWGSATPADADKYALKNWKLFGEFLAGDRKGRPYDLSVMTCGHATSP